MSRAREVWASRIALQHFQQCVDSFVEMLRALHGPHPWLYFMAAPSHAARADIALYEAFDLLGLEEPMEEVHG